MGSSLILLLARFSVSYVIVRRFVIGDRVSSFDIMLGSRLGSTLGGTLKPRIPTRELNRGNRSGEAASDPYAWRAVG
jgi:hypothetical protein